MSPPVTKSPEMDDAAETSARIERLLEELRGTVSPLAWQRVDELVTEIVSLYGRGLGRMLEAIEPSRRVALADDALVASLLALHGLHPLPVEERIRRALAEVAPQLGRVELVACAGGVAQVRALDAAEVAGARVALEQLLREAAPELERVEIDGLREPSRGSALVQIDLSRSRAAGGAE